MYIARLGTYVDLIFQFLRKNVPHSPVGRINSSPKLTELKTISVLMKIISQWDKIRDKITRK